MILCDETEIEQLRTCQPLRFQDPVTSDFLLNNAMEISSSCLSFINNFYDRDKVHSAN